VPDAIGLTGLERAVAVAQEDTQVTFVNGEMAAIISVISTVGRHDILLTVPVEVSHRNRNGPLPCVRGDGGSKRAVPLAKQDAHPRADEVKHPRVRRCDVGDAITVEITDGQTEWGAANRVTFLRFEAAIALA